MVTVWKFPAADTPEALLSPPKSEAGSGATRVIRATTAIVGAAEVSLSVPVSWPDMDTKVSGP